MADEERILWLVDKATTLIDQAGELGNNKRYEEAADCASKAVELLMGNYDSCRNDQRFVSQLAYCCRENAWYMMLRGRHQDAKSLNQLAFSAYNELYDTQQTDTRLYNLGLQAEQSGDNLVELQDTASARAMYSLALQSRQNHLMNNDTQKNRTAVERIEGKLKKITAQPQAARPQATNIEDMHDFFDFNYEEGDREFESGQFREAAESYANSVKAGLAIVEYQGGLQNMRNTAMACKKAGDTLLKLRRFGEAVDYFGQMEELAHRTLAGGGDHTDLYLANLAQAWAGSAYAAWGRVQDARKKYNDALQSAQALASINPSQFQNMPNDYIAILNSL